MPRRCSVCFHPERATIEKALLAGEAFRNIAQRFGTSPSALVRHRKQHLPARLAKAREAAEIAESKELIRQQRAQEAEEVSHAIDVVKQLKAINAACLEVLKKARTSGDDSTLLRSVDRIHRQIELQARLLGEIQEGPSVNVLVMPEWRQIRDLLVEALRPYPEAQLAVARALQNVGA
jgi:hypothetical protein